MDRLVYERRRERLRELMHERKIAALLVSHAANRYYLSGFELHDPQLNESAGRLLIMADGKDWICTDARYLDAARRLWDSDRIFIYGFDAAGEIGGLVAGLTGAGEQIGFEANAVTLPFYEGLGEKIDNTRLVRTDGLVERLRLIKEPEEIRRMELSCALNERLMLWLPTFLEPGLSEADVAWGIERFFRENGAEELAFASIVGEGRNAALPHYIPSRQEILREDELVLIDVGCRMNAYCSDQTRTFWVGQHPSERFLQMLEAVKDAQRRGIAAIRPGVPACDVYREARRHFEDLGVADAFTHGLGHGVGLETHEGPSLNSRNTTILRPGMVVTVEPGLYYADWGGIRWEHMALVTEEGCRLLGTEAE